MSDTTCNDDEFEYDDDDSKLETLAEDDRIIENRARAKEMLPEITRAVKQALDDEGIDLDIFFLFPNSGSSLLIFGTPTDPSDEIWQKTSQVVISVTQQLLQTRPLRCWEVASASTASTPTAAEA